MFEVTLQSVPSVIKKTTYFLSTFLIHAKDLHTCCLPVGKLLITPATVIAGRFAFNKKLANEVV